MMPAKWIQKGSMNFVRSQKRRDALGIVKQRENVRLGKQPAQRLHDFFSAAHAKQPIVNNGAPHQLALPTRFTRRPFLLELWAMLKPKCGDKAGATTCGS